MLAETRRFGHALSKANRHYVANKCVSLFLLKFGYKGMHFVLGMYEFAYKGTAQVHVRLFTMSSICHHKRAYAI